MNSKFGFFRVAAVSQKIVIGDVHANVAAIRETLKQEDLRACDMIVFQEHALTGYTVGDLFFQDTLLNAVKDSLFTLAKLVGREIVVVGAPIAIGNGIYNCAVVLNNGNVVGIVPKQYLPNYKEFYEARWFKPGGSNDPREIILHNGKEEVFVPFGVDLMFQVKTIKEPVRKTEETTELIIAGEVCEDLFMPIPPTSHSAIAGATILFNCSASPEQVAKHKYRRDLVQQQSGRTMSAYVYASSGPSESTSDLVFGGHCLIAENANMLTESIRVGDGTSTPEVYETHWCIADVDYKRLLHDRRMTTSFFNEKQDKTYRRYAVRVGETQGKLCRYVPAFPFVPSDQRELKARCTEIFDIQTAGLRRRVEALMNDHFTMSIGVSGGLDSTLALLCLLRVCCSLKINVERHVRALTMPGFGTGDRTKNNAYLLCKAAGVPLKEIDIRPACFEIFKSIGHDPFGISLKELQRKPEARTASEWYLLTEQLKKLPADAKDLTFENVQARHRTALLMANGFVIGTGDMSEIALGWCTYNGDHISNYNTNSSIPKTLVQFLVTHVASLNVENNPALAKVLYDIADCPISPELLPVAQHTETTIGPYELHDFFLFNMVRNGFTPEKIVLLATHAKFSKSYNDEEIRYWLKLFYQRFFASQFKRDAVPNGPKVGSLSLSPRGDWRMPSDAVVRMWIDSL